MGLQGYGKGFGAGQTDWLMENLKVLANALRQRWRDVSLKQTNRYGEFSVIYIYFIYTPNSRSRVSVFVQEREQGRFYQSCERDRESSRGAGPEQARAS